MRGCGEGLGGREPSIGGSLTHCPAGPPPAPCPAIFPFLLSLLVSPFTSGGLCFKQTDGLFCLILFGLCHI